MHRPIVGGGCRSVSMRGKRAHFMLVLLTILWGILAYVAYDDLRHFRIRNDAVAALVAVTLVRMAAEFHVLGALVHTVFALAILAVAFAAFSAGWMGAGDAKLLSAACLWFGPESSLVFAILLLPCTLAYAILAWLRVAPTRQTPRARLRIPFGPSLAVAWMGGALATSFG